MAATDNSIGEFDFIALRGNANAPSQQIVVDQRIGVSGTELTQTGERGTPFTVLSQVDVLDLNAGRATYREYLALINGNVVVVVKDGESSMDGNWQAVVLEVRLRRLVAVSGSVGGLGEEVGAFLECEWTLIAIAN